MFVKLSVPTLLLSFMETPLELKSPPTIVTVSPIFLKKKLMKTFNFVQWTYWLFSFFEKHETTKFNNGIRKETKKDFSKLKLEL